MTVETKDILLEAAEDVQSGMWCQGEWYQALNHNIESAFDAFKESELAERALTSHRCAQGSLAVATYLLDGSKDDYEQAEAIIDNAVASSAGRHFCLIDYNDALPNDPFEAGQQLAELFRTTAESL